MFLEKIDNYDDESGKLKALYSKQCSICNGDGIIPSENGHVNCSCIKKANIQARLLCNGLPRKYLNTNWDNLVGFEKDSNLIFELNNFCININDNMFSGNNLFIHNSDKNKIMMLDAALINDLAFKKNFRGYFHNILIVTVEDLMQAQYVSKNNFEIRNKLQKAVESVDILILNYIGEETDNRVENTSKYINNLITKRIFDEKLNIITSTLETEDIANRYGPQFVSIISHNFKSIRLTDDIMKAEKVGDQDNGYY